MAAADDPSASNPVRAAAWAAVALLWAVALLNYLDRLLLSSMREAIEASVPMTEAQFGLLTSVFLWVYAAVSPFTGYLADRFSRKWVIVSSLLAWSLCTWLTGHAASFTALFLARAGMGVSEACYLPAALALITDFHRGRTRSFATGLHATGLYAGLALGGIGGYVAADFGWRWGFAFFGWGGVLYAAILAGFLREAPVAAAESVEASRQGLGSAVAEVLAYRGMGTLIGVNLLIGISNWLIYAWMPTFLEESFQLGAGAAGVSATLYLQASSFVGVLSGGKWADRWAATNSRGRRWVPAIGYLFSGPALCLVASTHSLAAAIGALVLFGLGKGFYDANVMPILRQVTCERHSATGYGLLNCTSTLAGGLMTYAGGALRDRHLPLAGVFQATAGGLVVAGILLGRLKGPEQRTARPFI